jgi:hypothetical protein
MGWLLASSARNNYRGEKVDEETMLCISISTLIVAILTLGATIVACFIACRIPKRNMANQLFADLVAEYRTPQMGGAVLEMFRFYKCLKKKKSVNKEYQKLYKVQIGKPLKKGKKVNFSNTLHFQRRLVAQFYTDMSDLYFDNPDNEVLHKKFDSWFTENELQLLKIILDLAKPADEVFVKINNVPEPLEIDRQMYQSIRKLYVEVKMRIYSK